MTVTSGFYVRSFCHDLGVKVGSAAMMAELCRSRQGDFVLGTDNCLEFDDLSKGEEAWAPQLEKMLTQWNSKSEKAPSQAPARAAPAQNNAQKSVEVSVSPPRKRKASEEPEAAPGSPSKKSNIRPSSRERKSASPKEDKEISA
ncbi:hypothetical protein PG989_003448 [Apiospora arundinis]